MPADFDIAVNGLLEKPNYQSVRNLGEHQVRAQAKIINSPAGFCIVLSFRLFYSEYEDIQTRAFVYIHELTHLVNSSKFLIEEIHSQSDTIYARNLERFFDEYIADRKAYAVIDKLFLVKSELWKSALIRQASSFIIALTDSNHMQEIKESIQQLQVHQDITIFLPKVVTLFDEILVVLAHSFSLSDCYPNHLPISELSECDFVNGKTIALIDHVRQNYLNNDYQLIEGIPFIKEFMQNFGVAFSDSSSGLVCNVDYSDF